MNYKKIYDSLIERSRNRVLNSYKEKHHVVPRCVGGTDDSYNLVDLTPEEHYLAHQLLVRIYSDNHKLIRAAAMMIPNRPSNKMYGWLKRRFSKAQSISQSGSGNSQYGTKWCHNPETQENKKIRDVLPEGWVFGKYKKPNEININKRDLKKQNNIRMYSEYYKLYKEVGFDKFVEITGYQFSKQNLVQRFAKLLDDFEPQNGKKR